MENLAARVLGRRVLAVLLLTFKAAFRYRLVQVLLLLLLGSVIALPSIIKHDGTAQGFTQILLTYTLGTITVILGFVTLWLACGTLARDVEECQMQVVAVKPIARWQIWLGKWLGIMVLNLVLLGTSGATVYGLLQWRASQLPPELREQLNNEILVARGVVRQKVNEAAIEAEVERQFQERLKTSNVSNLDRELLRQQVREGILAQIQIVPPNTWRAWQLDFGRNALKLDDQPLFVRAKFYTAQTYDKGTYDGVWEVGPEEGGQRFQSRLMSLAPETYHEFQLPAGLLDNNGRLTVRFLNYNDTALLFPLNEDLEVLYRQGGFGGNFTRGLVIILCWMGLLAAIGLAGASFLSFPVAAFVSAALLIVGLSTGTMRQIVSEGGVTGVDPNTGTVVIPSLIDRAAVFLFKGLLSVVNLVQEFSPVDSLSTGRTVTWGELGLAVLRIVLLMGGLFAAFGMWMFTRRELATAQNA